LSAQYLVKLLIDKKENFSVAGTSRSKIKFKEKEVKSFYLEEEKFDLKITEYLKDVTHVLVSTPPKIEDVIIKNFYDILSLNKKLTWLGYLSSTSVYGLHAEKKFLQTNLPVRIFRLSGIYSKERNVLDRLKHQEIRVVQMKNQIFSRIHVEDIAQTLWNSFQKSKVKDIFNVSDDMPCSYKEVVEYASKLLGLEKPKEVSFKDLPEGSMKNFYLDSKKVSNQKAKLMGLQLKYPTYKEGLDSIFNQFN